MASSQVRMSARTSSRGGRFLQVGDCGFHSMSSAGGSAFGSLGTFRMNQAT